MMRRILYLALIPLALMTTSAVAQQMGGGPGGADRRQQMLFKDITLTPVQQAQVDSIHGVYREKMQAMGRPAMGDTAAMAQRRQVMTQEQADLRVVLTKDQQAIFDKNVADMNQRMRDRMNGERPNQ